MTWKRFTGLGIIVTFLFLYKHCCFAQIASPLTPTVLTRAETAVVYGPYNGRFLQGGLGLVKKLHDPEPLASAQCGWSLSLRFKTDDSNPTTLLAGIGSPGEASPRYLALRGGQPVFWAGGSDELVGGASFSSGTWHELAISVDASGIAHLIADGQQVAAGKLALGPASFVLELAPTAAGFRASQHFGGLLAQVSLRTQPLSTDDFQAMTTTPAGLDNLPFEEGSKPWPVQRRGPSGMTAPQDPALLPHSAGFPQQGKAIPPLAGQDEPTANGAELNLRHGWQMADASTIKTLGSELSSLSFNSAAWMQATVPGTVLTTLIDRGVYPDPDYGLNNMAIPESLSKKSFWYREVFTPPTIMRGRHLQLTFHGINYRAAVWLNGKPLGEIVGAFRHKSFDVTALAHPGEKNVVAILIDPPPHSGIAHEQSLAAGSGDNGGLMMLDGPTFGATEGWDWIPAIRDRNMGLWQDVTLTAAGPVSIDTPQIITHLPDRTRAEITVRIPLTNAAKAPVKGTVEIAFDGTVVAKPVTVPSGGTTVEFKPADFAQLIVQNPKLWWPNGYGAPELHTMRLSFRTGGKLSDTREQRFGIRELTYELSAFDSTGHVRRVAIAPTEAELLGHGAIVGETHEDFRETPEGWVPTLLPAMEHSLAVRDVTGHSPGFNLLLRVNGVKIAVKGGAWGMDDIRKRISRERMEPFFRLHREANVNMIRNWMGQNTEDIFFDLADEYGMLVWSDFWDSTQDWNLEPDDAGLFLDNARDTIHRYRNHPSIAVWCGRNEGVPPPTINEGLARLIAELDGTRFYSADSNKINLHDSGPYKYQEPEDYFTTLSRGFAVEVGLASPPTLESFQSFLPKEDQWPISDDWAYHDWHQGGNGDTAPFVQTMIEEFGPPTSLADFDRKAQMLNFESHRAVFEGFNAHLWQPNTGRLLWMTQPAWPSSVWQIFSHDYDTQASFYGVKHAAEPIHIQMNLPGHEVAVVNNIEAALPGVQVSARVYDTASQLLLEKSITLTAAPNAVTIALGLELQAAMETAGTVLIKLELTNASGKVLSDNFYWTAARKADLQRLNNLPAVKLEASAIGGQNTAGEALLTVTLRNSSIAAALAAKLTIKDAATGERILPAYYSDNYVSLVPGESKVVEIAYPKGHRAVNVALRGWNVVPDVISVQPGVLSTPTVSGAPTR